MLQQAAKEYFGGIFTCQCRRRASTSPRRLHFDDSCLFVDPFQLQHHRRVSSDRRRDAVLQSLRGPRKTSRKQKRINSPRVVALACSVLVLGLVEEALQQASPRQTTSLRRGVSSRTHRSSATSSSSSAVSDSRSSTSYSSWPTEGGCAQGLESRASFSFLGFLVSSLTCDGVHLHIMTLFHYGPLKGRVVEGRLLLGLLL